MNEVEWTRGVSELLNKEFKNYSIEAGKKLTYANQNSEKVKLFTHGSN